MPAEVTRPDPAAPALLPGWVVIGSVTLPGRPECVRAARQFVADRIGPHPRADEVLLLTSEVVTNAVLHSKSADPDGTVVVMASRLGSALLMTVTDDGSAGSLPTISPGEESGNGLVLVQSLADRWGYLHDEAGTTVWFTIGQPCAGPGQVW